MARVQEVAMYFDFKTDESYTPQKISIRAANCFNELQEIKLIDLDEPTGWFAFDLGQTNSAGQIVVYTNHKAIHQNNAYPNFNPC
jgi:anaphase-promoting complex subunit 10